MSARIIFISSDLHALPYSILREITLFLDGDSYLALIGSCKDIRVLGDDETLISNHARDVARIFGLVFDDKRNVFITGSGGCGKTHVLNRIYDLALKLRVKIAMTATTGIASINLKDGRTLHSFSGLRKGTIPIDKLEQDLKDGDFKIPKIWRETDLLVCDEISMNGARFLSKLDMVGQYARTSNKPLGGIQMVVSGDFLQLNPVADKFCFTSQIWNELDFVSVKLRFPFRQNQDINYYKFLQRIRLGEPTDDDITFLEDRHEYTIKHLKEIEDMDIKPTRLMAKQLAVRKINHDEFIKLPTPIEFTFNAEDHVVERVIVGKKAFYQPSDAMTLKNAKIALKGRAEHQAPECIEFKAGAQYVMTQNFSIKSRHINGSRCVYRSGGFVEFLDGSTMTLPKCLYTFYYPVGSNIFICRKQIALRLGYAATIHCAQGCTLEHVILNLGSSIFCSSQAYVALSRVRSAKGLYISDFCKKSIKTNKEAIKFVKELDEKN